MCKSSNKGKKATTETYQQGYLHDLWKWFVSLSLYFVDSSHCLSCF